MGCGWFRTLVEFSHRKSTGSGICTWTRWVCWLGCNRSQLHVSLRSRYHLKSYATQRGVEALIMSSCMVRWQREFRNAPSHPSNTPYGVVVSDNRQGYYCRDRGPSRSTLSEKCRRWLIWLIWSWPPTSAGSPGTDARETRTRVFIIWFWPPCMIYDFSATVAGH